MCLYCCASQQICTSSNKFSSSSACGFYEPEFQVWKSLKWKCGEEKNEATVLQICEKRIFVFCFCTLITHKYNLVHIVQSVCPRSSCFISMPLLSGAGFCNPFHFQDKVTWWNKLSVYWQFSEQTNCGLVPSGGFLCQLWAAGKCGYSATFPKTKLSLYVPIDKDHTFMHAVT